MLVVAEVKEAGDFTKALSFHETRPSASWNGSIRCTRPMILHTHFHWTQRARDQQTHHVENFVRENLFKRRDFSLAIRN